MDAQVVWEEWDCKQVGGGEGGTPRADGGGGPGGSRSTNQQQDQCGPILTQSSITDMAQTLRERSTKVEWAAILYGEATSLTAELVTEYIVQDADSAFYTIPSNAWGTMHAHPSGTVSGRTALWGDYLQSLNTPSNRAHFKIVATPDSLFLMDRYVLDFKSSILEACGK